MAYVDKCFSAEQSCSAGKLGSLRGPFTAKHSCRTVLALYLFRHSVYALPAMALLAPIFAQVTVQHLCLCPLQ